MVTELSVLLLPGGKDRSDEVSRTRQLANVRMILFGWALRRRLGNRVHISRAQYRLRGWNQPNLDALRDAERALERVQQRRPGLPVVLVGHSMGGRVAAHLSSRDGVRAVVALAPWWPRDDASLIPADRALLVLHGTNDTWTDPVASRTQTERRGPTATWIGMTGAGHFMVSQSNRWHGLTADFISAQLERS